MALSWVTDTTYHLFIFTFSLVVCWTIYRWFQSRNYPPGPMGLPVVGFAPFMGEKPNVTLRDVSKKYGDIFSFYIGPKLHVCITDYHLAKEIVSHPLMLGRPPHSFDFIVGQAGFSGKNGEEWQEQRRFTMHNMRNLGLGKGLWETMIQESAADFVEEVKTWKGQPTNIEGPLLFNQTNNNISLLMGRHLDKKEDAEDLEVIITSTRKLMKYFSALSINVTLPWITKFFELFNIGGYKDFITLLRRFEDIFRHEVDKRMKSENALTKDDFIGCYLQEMKKSENDPNNRNFNKDNLLGNLVILFMAGNDSTIAFLSWLLLFMAENQDIQKKIHDEIDATVGRDGVVYYDDRMKLPYTMATIMEMARWVSISPIFPPRYAMSTLKFRGYTIPQGCHVIVNIWSIMHDSRYFEDPMEFKPERFLIENGTKVSKVDGYAPFSFGKRNCPGEGVAIMSVYLYFVSIMQKTKIMLPPGKKADFEWVFAGALLPKPQELCFIER